MSGINEWLILAGRKGLGCSHFFNTLYFYVYYASNETRGSLACMRLTWMTDLRKSKNPFVHIFLNENISCHASIRDNTRPYILVTHLRRRVSSDSFLIISLVLVSSNIFDGDRILEMIYTFNFIALNGRKSRPVDGWCKCRCKWKWRSLKI